MKKTLHRLLETAISEDGSRQFILERQDYIKKRFLWWTWFEWTEWKPLMYSCDKESMFEMYNSMVEDEPFTCEMMPVYERSKERAKYRAEQRAERQKIK